MELLGDLHIGTRTDTPMREDAFVLSNKQKKAIISEHFREIMETLGLDLNDDSLSGTPDRVAKMFVEEIYSGLDPRNKPKLALFENKYDYNEMLIERDIHFYSNCEHHFVPIEGKAHIVYIPKDHVVGLSKLNRLVNYYAKRPQVQERMTNQIGQDLVESLKSEDVAVVIDAKHLCVSSRGIKDVSSMTTTVFRSGKFKNEEVFKVFLNTIKQ